MRWRSGGLRVNFEILTLGSFCFSPPSGLNLRPWTRKSEVNTYLEPVCLLHEHININTSWVLMLEAVLVHQKIYGMHLHVFLFRDAFF